MINFLHELFTRYNLPDEIILDYASRFMAGEFKAFAIKYITTPVYHLRSNGSAERFIDPFKKKKKYLGV